MINHISNEKEFNEIVKSKQVCLVDFFATWCGPCRMLSIELEDAVNENPNIEVVKVDVDECMGLAEEFGIEVVPTIVVFKDGKQVQTLQGYLNKEQILELVNIK